MALGNRKNVQVKQLRRIWYKHLMAVRRRSCHMMTSSNGNIFCVTGPLCWEFTGGRPVNSPYKGQWRGALMFSLICNWINDWANNRKAGDLRRNRAHYDVVVMNNKETDGLSTSQPHHERNGCTVVGILHYTYVTVHLQSNQHGGCS